MPPLPDPMRGFGHRATMAEPTTAPSAKARNFGGLFRRFDSEADHAGNLGMRLHRATASRTSPTEKLLVPVTPAIET
jgi:hypothetical protein